MSFCTDAEWRRRISPYQWLNQNVGWKDSGNAIVYPDGRIVELPIGVCELQGYVYDAKLRMAEVFAVTGKRAHADRLRREAAALKERFNQTFWMEGAGFYALAPPFYGRTLCRCSGSSVCLAGIRPPKSDPAVSRSRGG